MSSNRLIRASDIPDSLWINAEKCLQLAPSLKETWRSLLEKQNLYDLACTPGPDGEIGGISPEDTAKHLTWRFSGSSARVQMAILDPKAELDDVSDAFAKVFAGARVLLADLPCGSGAAFLSILATLAELRRASKLPRTAITVVIVGAEISPSARENSAHALQLLLPMLAEECIFVEYEFLDWNVCDPASNADLINRLAIRGDSCNSKLLLLANFSGFLARESKWKEAEPQLRSIFMHSRDKQSFALWIEPRTNTVIEPSGGFFSRVLRWFSEKFKFIIPLNQDNIQIRNAFAETSSDVLHPLRPDHKFNNNLAVIRFDLPSSKA